jgi:hypothetical protein
MRGIFRSQALKGGEVVMQERHGIAQNYAWFLKGLQFQSVEHHYPLKVRTAKYTDTELGRWTLKGGTPVPQLLPTLYLRTVGKLTTAWNVLLAIPVFIVHRVVAPPIDNSL